MFAAARRAGAEDGARRGDAGAGRLPAAPGGAAAGGGRVPAQRPRGGADHRANRPAGAGGDVPPHGGEDGHRHPGRRRLGAGDGREAAAGGDVPGAVRGRHAAAATPSRPATSTGCCAAWTRRAVCVGPAPSAPAASAPSARPPACSPARSARRSCARTRCGSRRFDMR